MNTPSRSRYTRSLAKLYADQGRYDKAVEIYQHLMNEFPGRQDILDDFADLKVRMERTKTAGKPQLPVLFRHWLELIQKYRQVHGISLPDPHE
jgi:hypothetical protein